MSRIAGGRSAGDRSGVVVVDKPAGLTSFGVIKAVRRVLRVRKVGHTGTLDPMATGVLPVCVGEATKIASLLLTDDKTYLGSARLGLDTNTLDITGTIVRQTDPSAVSRAQVEAALATRLGTIDQVPPAFSAVHSDGKRAYERARQGETVTLKPRQVVIYRFALRDWRAPEFDFDVECSKGTYVRSLVAEIGRILGCGATLSALRRLRCGTFHIDESIPLQRLTDEGGAGEDFRLRSIDDVLSHLPGIDVSGEEARKLRHGQPLGLDAPDGLLRLRCEGALIALGERREGRVWPKRVFRKLRG